MRIGLDLDNTIINYDQSFIELAKSTGLINQGFLGSKTDLRDGIRAMDDGEKLWQKLQGSVYGKEIFRQKLTLAFKGSLPEQNYVTASVLWLAIRRNLGISMQRRQICAKQPGFSKTQGTFRKWE